MPGHRDAYMTWYTYSKSGLGAAEVVGLDVEGASDLPLGLGLLDLASETDSGLDAILVVESAGHISGLLVVSEGDGLRALAVVSLSLGDGLLNGDSGVVLGRLLFLSLEADGL